MITKAQAEFLLNKQGDRTAEETRELGKWWLRKLRRLLKRLEPTAATAAEIRAQGKQDADPSCRRVVNWVQAERSVIIGTATALAATERYAEFREDFEDIAARAGALT